MHELGIAESVITAVRAEAARHTGRAAKVGLRIGPLAGIDRNSLEFCFEAVTKDTEFDSLKLAIEDGVADELEFTYLELEEDQA